MEEDYTIRDFLTKKLQKTGLDKVEIERSANAISVILYSSRPGLLIGRGGAGVEDLKKATNNFLQKKFKRSFKNELKISIEEVKNPESKATVVAQNIAEQIEKRIPFRRTLKQGVEKIMQSKEVQGAKIMIGGRLAGGEIARREWLAKGKIPLQTLRANVEYADATAFTTYGTVGIKVWVYFRDVFEKEKNKPEERTK